MFNVGIFLGEMPKKMRSAATPRANIASNSGRNTISAFAKESKSILDAIAYTLPVYKSNASGSYIEFRAFDPARMILRRKIIKLNHIKGQVNRRRYAADVIRRLNQQLQQGWNPWIDRDTSNLATIGEALERYESHVDRMYASQYYRPETYFGYKSYVKNLRCYIEEIDPIYYCYQLDRRYLTRFLDYIFIERNNTAQTRNNYLNFLRVFSSFLLEKQFITVRPTDGIAPIPKRLYQKEREYIPNDVLKRITGYLRIADPNYHILCSIVYHCLIRPVEITRLHVSDINVRQSTITIPGSSSKNHKTQSVTIPHKLLHEIIEAGVLSAPPTDYIFSSDGLRPGATPTTTKILRDHWSKMRRALKLPAKYKLYSLKDTGITDLLLDGVPTINVRDQARHSSIATTEIYASHDTPANPLIARRNTSF